MIYTLHQRFELGENGTLTRNLDAIEAVPESTSKWALIIPPLWMIWHGLWSAFFIYCLFSLFLLGLLFTDFWPISVALSGLPGLYLWLEGNQLRRKGLEDAGYEQTDIVEAPDEDVALARLIVGHSAPKPVPVVEKAPAPVAGPYARPRPA